ncbi:phage major capsid protein [Mesorhizobium sp. CAU 1741]|uniref:phage major capsid protein n=1 Tax=Mesorhizobium sp. CAU 1741 TaxID=3140366 RepID=UPI00325ADD07
MTVTRRAYSYLTIKSVSEDKRIIRGIATTPAVDRVGDIVEPMGVKFQNPMPFLWQHDAKKPIGTVKFDKPTEDGITFEAEIPQIAEDGLLRDRIEEAWQSIKLGLVRAVSIGFRAIEYAFIEGTNGIRFVESEVYELSAVTIPAQPDAVMTSIKNMDPAGVAVIKQFDTNAPAATGTIERPAKSAPAPRGKSTKPVNLRPKEATTMKTIAEQIAALEQKRAANAGRMEEIMTKSAESGRSTDEAEQEEFDTLESEVSQIDGDLKRFRALEKAKVNEARPVDARNSNEGAASRDVRAPVQVKSAKAAPGIEFARLARAKALSHLDHEPAREIAKRLYGEDSAVTALLTKAAVTAGSSISGNWAADLVGAETDVYADFAEFLRPMTIVGKFGVGNIPSLMNIPFRTPLITQTGGGTGYWVGEGKPKPLTAFDFDRTTLDELKVAAISVVTEELLRKSSPSADTLLRNSLAAAVAARIDTTFINPSVSASAGVSPASITNGVSAIASTGNDADAIREDIRALWATFIAANNPPTTAVYVMSTNTALALSLLRNPLGQTEFPGLNMMGGTFEGIPVITSEYLAPVSAGGFVALVNASDIYFGDEGGVQVDMSREASLQMLDNPTNASSDGTATTMVSMFQTNSVAFRAERILNWKKRRASAVAVLDEVNWGMPSS